MKRISLFFVLAMSAVLLAGCSGKKNEETAAPSVEAPATKESAASESTGSMESMESMAQTEAAAKEAGETRPGYMRSHLTGEWIDEETGAKRPVAVMINNLKPALPQSGLSQADVMYECMVEGDLTRLMAIFQSVDGIDKIGPVRSARTYFVYLAGEWNAFYFHFGQCEYAKPYLSQYATQNVNGVLGGIDGSSYYRTDDRQAPHNAYTSGGQIEKAIEEKPESEGYIRGLDEYYLSLQKAYSGTGAIEPSYTEHFNFAKDGQKVTLDQGAAAKTVYVGFPSNDSSFTYDSASEKYLHSQYGGKHIDQETGQQLAYDNVFILYSKQDRYFNTDYRQFDLWSGGDGYYLTQGRAIPIQWDKNTEWGPMVFLDKDGKEITVNQGKTWISIVPVSNQDKTVIE